MLAARYGHNEAVRVLLGKMGGCDAAAKDKQGRTALTLATSAGHPKVVRQLMERAQAGKVEQI